MRTYSLSETADALSVSTGTVSWLIKYAGLAVVEVAGRRRVPVAKLKQWVAKQPPVTPPLRQST